VKWFHASYKSVAHNISWHTAGELLQQQQINGRGSEQAVDGNCSMPMHKRNKGRGSPCSKYHCFEKWGWLTKRMLQWQPLLCFQIVIS